MPCTGTRDLKGLSQGAHHSRATCHCCVCVVQVGPPIADSQLLQEGDEMQVAGQAPLRRSLLTVPTELEEKDLTALQRKTAEKGLINTQRSN